MALFSTQLVGQYGIGVKFYKTSIELFQDFKKSPVIFIIGVIAFIIFGAVIILTSLLMINTLNTIADGQD